jgi:hypothetical protein
MTPFVTGFALPAGKSKNIRKGVSSFNVSVAVNVSGCSPVTVVGIARYVVLSRFRLQSDSLPTVGLLRPAMVPVMLRSGN